MNTIALITEEHESDAAQWQFDKVMSAIAYDCDLTIVFYNKGIQQLQLNQAWKCLNIYGITSIYVINEKHENNADYLIKAENLNMNEFKQIISQSELLI